MVGALTRDASLYSAHIDPWVLIIVLITGIGAMKIP